MGSWVHRLSQIDPDARTAVCEHCGPVAIVPRGAGRWRCSAALAANREPHHEKVNRRSARKKRLRRRVAIALYKTLVGCERCGFTNPNPAMLHIHHPEGDGLIYSHKFQRSRGDRHLGATQALQRDSRAGFVAELLRCEVLCANCHRFEHARNVAPVS